MSNNTKLWDELGKTDPKHTKGFIRAGGFKGTAIKPMWVYRRLTEQFGPVGVGWGHNKPDYTTVPTDGGEVLVYCTAECWHTDRANTFHGVGGDKAVAKNKNGLLANDEAFKSAFTDAVMNAFKSVGVGADVHMGWFDDDKYLREVEQEFAEPTLMIDAAGEAHISRLAPLANVTMQQIVRGYKVSTVGELTAAQYRATVKNLEKRIEDAKEKEAA